MPDHAALRAVAFATEMVRARRLARRAKLSDAEALRQILTAVAGQRTLDALIAERHAESARELARRAARLARQMLARERKRVDSPAGLEFWQAWFDGSAVPNPGQIGLGGLLRSPAGVTTELSLNGDIGDSNQAEYMALIAVLELALQQRATSLQVFGDSKIVLDDVMSSPGIAGLKSYRLRAQQLLAQIGAVECHWIPRHRNGVADALAVRAVRNSA